MATSGSLSPLMMIAGAGLLENQGLGVNSTLTSNLTNFDALPVVTQFSDVITSASGTLSSSVLDNLRKMGQDFVALTNAIPSASTSALQTVAPNGLANGGFTGLIGSMADGIMGDGDISKFVQIWNAATGYIGQANDFVNSVLNVNRSIGQTFGPITGGMDNLITGSFNQVSEAFGALGTDFRALGSLLDMNNLPNLGLPLALVQQIVTVGGITPAVDSLLRQAGVTGQQIADLASGTFSSFTDSANRLLYEGMTKITGQELQQVKKILGVTTPNISTMADLLDPAKILPNSYITLTMPTPDGLRGIYATTNSVNTNIEKFLIDPNAPIYTGDDPIVGARLGIEPVGGRGQAES